MEKYSLSDKENTWEMFDQISHRYDRINRILTFGKDKKWRKKLKDFLPETDQITLLDVATGSADQILALFPSKKIQKAWGIDLSENMLELAKKKTSHIDNISFEKASALKIPFEENSFECVSCSFGIRNVPNVEKSLAEMHRVLKKDGVLLILEFSVPSNGFFRFFVNLYTKYFLPKIGGFLSRNYDAYSYLNQSIQAFPYGEKFCNILKELPFKEVKAYPMHFGAVTLYKGVK